MRGLFSGSTRCPEVLGIVNSFTFISLAIDIAVLGTPQSSLCESLVLAGGMAGGRVLQSISCLVDPTHGSMAVALPVVFSLVDMF